MLLRRRWFVVGAGAVAVAGCGPVKGRVTRVVDGKKVTEEVEYENYRAWLRSVGREVVNPYRQMAQALAKAYQALRTTIKEMIAKLTEVPDPGVVQLADLDPDLAEHAGGPHDYVGDRFEYVRIGVAEYDAFFESSMALFAYTSQVHDSAAELRDRVGLRVGYGPVNKMTLTELVASGRASESSRRLSALVETMSGFAANYRERARSLRATGGNLAAGAKQSILNPRVLVHVDLIVKGLKQSVEAIIEAGKLLADLG